MTGNDGMRISVCGNVRWGGGDFSPLHFFPTADEIAILRMAERKDKARPFHIHVFFEGASRSCNEWLASVLFWDRYFKAGGSRVGEAQSYKEATGGLKVAVTD